uniref:RNA binding motif protein 6 n=1 Tax=Sus scrofa TaxID=9823 RepID=A0A8D1G0R5_PIG
MIAGKSSSLLILQKENELNTQGKLTAGAYGVCFFCSDRKPVGKEGIDNSSKGGCVQQATGWRKGTGLGYGHLGLASAEETEGRIRGPSVGAPGRTSKRQSNETYRDAVRRVMFARYKELD